MSDRLAHDYSPDADAQRTAQARAEIRSKQADAASASLIVIAVLAVLYTLYLAQEIVLPFVLAIVLNLLLQPARRFMTHRLRLPSALASLLLILALFTAVAGIAAGISVPASNWIGRAPEALPKLQAKLGPLRGPIEYLQKGAEQIEHMLHQTGPGEQQGAAGAPEAKPAQTVTVSQPSNLGGVGMSVLAGTKAFLGQLFTIVIMLFFLLWAGDTLLRSFVEIMPSFRDKRRVVEIGSEVEGNISGYLATITVMNILVGIANGLSTWACGLPDPLLWGTLAFLLNYIPILGPFSGVAIFFAVGLFTYDTIWWALLPAGIYLLIHVIEGETVTPMLIAARFTLNPVLVILSLFFWDWMWGVMGALLAVPLLAICKVICDHIAVLTPLGHIIGGSPRKGGTPA